MRGRTARGMLRYDLESGGRARSSARTVVPGRWRPAVIVGHIVGRLVRGVILGIVHHWFVTLQTLGLIGGGAYVLAAQGMIPGVTLPASLAPSSASATSGDMREMT